MQMLRTLASTVVLGLVVMGAAWAQESTIATVIDLNRPATIGSCDTGLAVEIEASAGAPGPNGYFTLRAAFDAINAGTHQGAIDIEVCGNTNEGSTPATLNSSGAGQALYNSVLIRPLLDGLTISGNPASGFGVIQLKGADNITLNGDNSNSPGTNRDLSIHNTAASSVIAGSVIRIATSAAVTSADNISLRNLTLNGNVIDGNLSTLTSTTSSSNSSFVIFAGGNGGASATDPPTAITSVTTNTAPAGTTINDLVIDNNALNQAARAVVFVGAASSVSTGVNLSNNLIGGVGEQVGAPPYTLPGSTVHTRGIHVAGANAVSITGNTIRNLLSFVGTTMNAIDLAGLIGNGTVNISGNTITGVVNNGAVSGANGIVIAASTSSPNVSDNTVTSVQTLAGATVNGISVSHSGSSGLIERNRVSTIHSRGADGFSAHGIQINNGSAWTVQNNFVRDINSVMNNDGLTLFGPFGIRVNSGNNHRIMHNTVVLSGTVLGSTSIAPSAALLIVNNSSTGLEVRNNIFANTLQGTEAGSSIAAVNLPSGGTSAMNLLWNHNDYFAPATLIAQVGTGGLSSFTAAAFNPGSTAGTDNLRGYTSTLLLADNNNDNASVVLDPQLISATDLHLSPGSPMRERGTTLASVTDDIDQQARPAGAAYDIGADELEVGNSTPSISALAITRRAGDGAAVSIVANVDDAEDSEQNLLVTVNGSGTATTNGVTVDAISTSASGVVSARIVADCQASDASFTLRVTDSGALFAQTNLLVTVAPNLAPELSYSPTTVVFGETRNVAAATGPADSGMVSSIVIQNTGSYGGSVGVNAAGAVILLSAAPVGNHTIVVRATDNCGLSTDASLPLEILRAGTTTTIESDQPDPSAVNAAVVVSFVVAPVAPGAGTPSGEVLISDGIDSCTGTVKIGQCTLNLGTPGMRTLTATYPGDASFTASSDTEPHTVGTGADLSISKSDSQSMLNQGLIQYTLVVANAGPSAANGAQVIDQFPAGLSNISWTCMGMNGGGCTSQGNGNIDQLVNLPSGASVVFSITANVPVPLPNSISNTASVSPPSGISDPAPGNNSSTVNTSFYLFRDGFEGPSPVKLAEPATGESLSLNLPVGELLSFAGRQATVVRRYEQDQRLILLQSRRVLGSTQMNLVQIHPDRSWTASAWITLSQPTTLYLDWAADVSARQRGLSQARLRLAE